MIRQLGLIRRSSLSEDSSSLLSLGDFFRQLFPSGAICFQIRQRPAAVLIPALKAIIRSRMAILELIENLRAVVQQEVDQQERRMGMRRLGSEGGPPAIGSAHGHRVPSRR